LSQDDLPALEQRISAHFKEELRIAPKLEWVAPETIPRETKKTRFIEIMGEET
jgi:hypothetical protein